jgi:SLT domain-containing protein
LQKNWNTLAQALPGVMNTMAKTIGNIFTGIGSAIRAVLNSVMRGVFGAVNSAIDNINRLIRAANSISAKVRGPQFAQLGKLNIPQFANGGIVTKPTLAMVGEGGEPEYIIPQSKMAAAAANYLGGARGDSVIPSGNAQINVTTGPVLQQGGQQYVSMADLERAMRKTADTVYASLRTPSSRIALGRA